MPGSEVIILWQGRRHFGGWPLRGLTAAVATPCPSVSPTARDLVPCGELSGLLRDPGPCSGGVSV